MPIDSQLLLERAVAKIPDLVTSAANRAAILRDTLVNEMESTGEQGPKVARAVECALDLVKGAIESGSLDRVFAGLDQLDGQTLEVLVHSQAWDGSVAVPLPYREDLIGRIVGAVQGELLAHPYNDGTGIWSPDPRD